MRHLTNTTTAIVVANANNVARTIRITTAGDYWFDLAQLLCLNCGVFGPCLDGASVCSEACLADRQFAWDLRHRFAEMNNERLSAHYLELLSEPKREALYVHGTWMCSACNDFIVEGENSLGACGCPNLNK